MIPPETKDGVIQKLNESGASFEAVSDLCEMAARKDSRLSTIASGDAPLRIAACHPRAVKWLFHQSGNPLPDDESVEICNMRDEDSETVSRNLLK